MGRGAAANLTEEELQESLQTDPAAFNDAMVHDTVTLTAPRRSSCVAPRDRDRGYGRS